MAYNTNQISVGNTATLIVAANADRIKITLRNIGSQTVYLGSNNSVTTSTGYPLLAGDVFEDSSTVTAWYGIVVSSTCTVAFEEQDITGVNG